MCCDDAVVDVPVTVREMLARYRVRLEEPVGVWGSDAWASPAAARGQEIAGAVAFQSSVARRAAALGEAAAPEHVYGPDAIGVVVRDALGEQIPPALGVVEVSGDSVRLESSASRPYLAGGSAEAWLLVDSSAGRAVPVDADGRSYRVSPESALLLAVAPGSTVSVDGERIDTDTLFTRIAPATLRLEGAACSRWSVVDELGWGWFPEGRLEKYDYHGRPFLHAKEVDVPVPAGRLDVSVTRGIGWTTERHTVAVAPGDRRNVELAPQVRFDPSAAGWYGADLHVHMNYGGAQVCEPADAARMQMGEGLDFMSLLAANIHTTFVYDREALEAWPAQDLPWSDGSSLARMGVEYRNDLLGHFHVTGPEETPALFATGHEDRPDWPPNSEAAAQYREAGATIGYCHPVFPEKIPWQEDAARHADPLERVMGRPKPRSVEAREVVADAALGLVDSLDVLSNADDRASAELYRRLLGSGLRLAVTAGTDAMLSVRHSSMRSNPPGWSRVYARTGELPDSESLKGAIRRCETVATNGPWLELDVDGRGPGSTVVAQPGARLPVVVRALGPGADQIALFTGGGRVGLESTAEGAWEAELRVAESTYVLATVEGDPHPEVLGAYPFAITSPVWVEVDGLPVRVEEDLRWCLRWLDELDALVEEHGRFESDEQRSDVMSTIDGARSWYLARLDGG